MPTEGFTEYKRREFCNDVRCPVQLELNKQPEKSETCEEIRKTCTTACCFTTYQFHHWLIEDTVKLSYPTRKPTLSAFMVSAIY